MNSYYETINNIELSEEEIMTISLLIKDEQEAIEGYNLAINSGRYSDKVVKVLEHIRDEEAQHIQELEELKGETDNE